MIESIIKYVYEISLAIYKTFSTDEYYGHMGLFVVLVFLLRDHFSNSFRVEFLTTKTGFICCAYKLICIESSRELSELLLIILFL